MRTRAGRLALVLFALLGWVHPSDGYFLDSARRFDVRLRAYSQLGIMAEGSEGAGCPDPTVCPPKYHSGDLAQHRNFYNPEFDANLTDFTKWMGPVTPDEFKFRFAWWGFYDGLYDYLDPEWNEHRQQYKARFSESDHPSRESFVFNDQNKNPRHIYASRNRINELYLDWTAGRFFFRVGRQAISWGESDTIAILDVSNPFDLTLGAPGFFQDLEESRIPLWTLRSTVKLIDNWEFLSSLFADMYLVPGPIDTTVPIDPITAGVSPFNPDQPDPQLSVAAQGPLAASLHAAVVSRQPENNWSNSRWGARLTGVVLRDYTVQGWFFRTFNQAPVPLLTNRSAIGMIARKEGTLVDDRGFRTPVCTDGKTPAGRACGVQAPTVTILERRLESVIGLAATWYSQPVNGIIRTEAEYFIDEPAFIPTQNLNPRVQIPGALRKAIGDNGKYSNSTATADYIRWQLAYDRFFFIPVLNPANSFLISAAYVSSFNLSEKGGMDYRTPLAKPGHSQTRNTPIPGSTLCRGAAAKANAICVNVDPHDFEDAYQYEGFLQIATQTDYMHGRLSPRIVMIADISGIFAFAPSLNFRVNDNLILGATYLAIDGTRKAGIGTFRAHDMVQLKATMQLN